MNHNNSIINCRLFFNLLYTVLFSLVSASAFALTIDQSGANIFSTLEDTTTTTLAITLTNLLSEGTVVIQFARALFIGLTVVMLIIYIIIWARNGTDDLDTKGIFFFIITVVIVNTLLYLPSSTTVNGVAVSTVWIGRIALEVYGMSITAGQLFFDAATGGIFPTGEGIEPLVKLIFRLRLIDEVSGIGGTIGFYIIGALIVVALTVFVGLIWVITSILPVIIAILGVLLIITLPLLLFSFGKSVFQSVVSLILGMLAAILAEWLAAALCMNMFSTFLKSDLTMGFLEINFIDVPIETLQDAAGILILIIVCTILATILPLIASSIGGKSTGDIGGKALKALKMYK